MQFTMDKGKMDRGSVKGEETGHSNLRSFVHSDADVDLLDYMIPDTVNHCKKEESSNTFELASLESQRQHARLVYRGTIFWHERPQ